VMERLEQQEAALAAATAAQEEARLTHDTAAAELDRVLADLDAEAAQVASDRAERVEGLDEGLVTLYERVRERSGGVGVAVLRGHRCEGCRLELNSSELAQITATPPEQVVRCDECGRILVRGVEA
jgi:predicted  nucleic acid-binding Zn-ribbon protein